MMKIFYLFLTIVLSIDLWACEVHLPERILILSSMGDLQTSYLANECSDSQIRALNSVLNELEGKISRLQLEELLRAKNQNIEIQPSHTQVQQFKNLAREHLLIPKDTHISSAKSELGANYIILNPSDMIQIECSQCLYGSNQALNVKIQKLNGLIDSHTISADFKKMVSAYRVRHFTPAFVEISPEVISKESIESIPHTELFNDLKNLKFYRTNKPLRPGELIKFSDLTAQQLVRAGFKTDVLIENKLIRLQTSGISRSSGSIGQFVEVFHPQKNKKYLGKVIDINKVVVEL